MNNNDKVRKRITFYGWVQGVGFRYRALYAAQSVGVTGWVHNEFDGSVLMEIQGTEDQIDKVIELIGRGSYIKIRNMDCRTIPLDEKERAFRVRY